ncbi:MAG: pilin [Candidatus Paceibacterota bacterium]
MDLFSIFLPNIAYADFNSFLGNFNSVIVNPLIRLLFAIGIAYFLYGVFVFLTNADNETERTNGKNHMLYGVIGLTVMMGVWGILNLVLNTLNITGIDPEAGTVQLNDYNPTIPFNPPGTGTNTGTGSGAGTGTGTTTGTTTGTGTQFDPVEVDPIGVTPIDDNLDPIETSDPFIPPPNTTNTNTTSGFDPIINPSVNSTPSTNTDPSLPPNNGSTSNTNSSQSVLGENNSI